MAVTDADLALIRSYIGDPEPTVFTDDVLRRIFEITVDEDGSTNAYRAAAEVWTRKAARYAELVAVAEAGSSRDLGALHRQALTMASHYTSLASGSGSASGAFSPPLPRTRVGRIRRP